MKHYIIIEVREREWPGRKGTDAGAIRSALHEFCKDRNINAADALIREDREWLHPLMQLEGATRERNPYHMAKQVFEKAMGPRWSKFKSERDDEISWDRKWQV